MFRLSSYLKSKRGTSIVLFTVVLTVISGISALVVDIGVVVFEKSKMQNATDAATLAGAQELITNPDNASNVARIYLGKNGVDPSKAEIVISDANTKISVTAKKDVEYTFAKIIGLDKQEVSAKSNAKMGPITSVYQGVRPFAIEEQNLIYSTAYVLKNGGGSGITGNYGAVALGGSGASTYESNIINGYNGELNVGEYISTEPGNMSGPTSDGITTLMNGCHHSPRCTYSSYNPACSKIITVIIVDDLDVNGRSDVKIVGFARFFLEGVAGSGNKSIVTGRFLKQVGTGEIGEISEGDADYGLRGVKLTQ